MCAQVVHRDIAVRNFLVDIDGRVMLCDFGLTKFLPDGMDHIDASIGMLVLEETLRLRVYHKVVVVL